MREINLEKPLALDGGFGGELEANEGIKIQLDPIWSARAFFVNPEAIVKVHKKFLEAGVDILTTNSYCTNIEVLCEEEKLTREEATDVVRQSVRLARKAIEQHKKEQGNNDYKEPILAGAVGPYATIVRKNQIRSEYSGWYVDSVDQKTMVDYFYNQALPLIEEGVDMLAFETVPALAEAQCILKALDLLPPDSPPAWLTFACKELEFGPLTNHGESFAESVELISGHAKIIAVGVNCTDRKSISPLLEQVQGRTHGKPLVVYPDARTYVIHPDQGTVGTEPKRHQTSDIVSLVPEWIRLGARIVGGCCAVNALETAAIARVVHACQ